MGIGAGFCMYEYDVVVKKFTFAISSPDEFLFSFYIIIGIASSQHRWTDLERSVRHITCFRARKCLLGSQWGQKIPILGAWI